MDIFRTKTQKALDAEIERLTVELSKLDANHEEIGRAHV